MEYTLEELKERLATLEETSLLDLLQVTSTDLVERFVDIIEDRFDDLQRELEELEDDSIQE